MLKAFNLSPVRFVAYVANAFFVLALRGNLLKVGIPEENQRLIIVDKCLNEDNDGASYAQNN